jgi:hypothetical protein
LAVGEKLFESKQKSTGFAVKSVGPEGVTVEQSWAGEFKGYGRAQGLSGTIMGTGTYVQAPMGPIHGTAHGILTTKDGEAIVIRSHGVGKIEGTKGKFAVLTTYMTTAPKLSWLNNTVSLDEGEGDTNFQEFTLTGQEWK